uniref:Clade I nitrous oxide reductase n=1 Tax=Macrostomum lignano TaxID=282301 RepID=A0A1I8GLK9_9PLAT
PTPDLSAQSPTRAARASRWSSSGAADCTRLASATPGGVLAGPRDRPQPDGRQASAAADRDEAGHRQSVRFDYSNFT